MQFEEGKERTREREEEREREREHNLDCPLKKMRTKFSFSSFLNNCVTMFYLFGVLKLYFIRLKRRNLVFKATIVSRIITMVVKLFV